MNHNRDSVTRDVIALVHRGVTRFMNIFSLNTIPSTTNNTTTSSTSSSSSSSATSSSSSFRPTRFNLFWRSSSSIRRERTRAGNPTDTTSTNAILAAAQRLTRQTMTRARRIVWNARSGDAVSVVRKRFGFAAGKTAGRKAKKRRVKPYMGVPLGAVENEWHVFQADGNAGGGEAGPEAETESDRGGKRDSQDSDEVVVVNEMECGGPGFLGFASEGDREEEVEEEQEGEIGADRYVGEEQAKHGEEMEVEMQEENRVCDAMGELFDQAPTLGRMVEE